MVYKGVLLCVLEIPILDLVPSTIKLSRMNGIVFHSRSKHCISFLSSFDFRHNIYTQNVQVVGLESILVIGKVTSSGMLRTLSQFEVQSGHVLVQRLTSHGLGFMQRRGCPRF